MELNKRGMIFTIVTIFILSLFSVSYGMHFLVQDRSAVNSRISTLNNFAASVEQDMPRQLFISGYRAIFLMEKNILDTGDYMEDVNDSLNELFFYGTLDSETQDLMNDATFSNMQSFLENNADKINAQIQLINPFLSIEQVDPWNLKLNLEVDILIEDKGNLAGWNKTASVESFIPINNFEDPFYSIGTSGKVLSKINQTPYEIFVSGADYTNLTSHFENSYYKASTSAPNFLMRLEGNFSPSETGIESMVNPEDLANVGILAKYKSVIDYIYFSGLNPIAYEIPQVSNLILDNESNHLEIYNVSGVAIPA